MVKIFKGLQMNKDQHNYSRLHELSLEAHTLGGISALLHWDQETYMPSGAAAIRSEQIKTLCGIIHKKKTEPKFATALSQLIDIKTGKIAAKSLNPAQIAALHEWRRDYLKCKVLPKKFVEDFAKLTSQATHAWQHARKENAFHQFAPFLEKIIEMLRKKADLVGYDEHPYDVLLDDYEHGTSTKEVSSVFVPLRKAITQLLKKISAQPSIDDSFLFGKFPESKQIEFSKLLLKDMHFDMNHGRLDFSTHPFSSASHPTDSRITTRIHSSSLMSNISTVLHEAGHGLYEMGLPVEQYGSPLGEAISLGMHESQSRWWEKLIGQSLPFWQHYFPLLQKQFKGQLDDISLKNFYKGINKVSPSFIRVEADEVTYSLHVILRYELEVALIEGSLAVRDIPEAWNAKMKELFGITPANNREGCLQDVHWSIGAFGYFPTYTLGNIYASHLFLGFERDFPDWEKRIAKGDLGFIKNWLSDSVYKHGRQYSSKELLQNVTGKPFSSKAYIQYLTNKYVT